MESKQNPSKELNSLIVSQESSRTLWEKSHSLEYQQYRKDWLNRPLEMDPGPVPLHLDIEATSNCNLRCTMCPRTEMLSDETFWKVEEFPIELYKDIIDDNLSKGLKSVKYQYLGEPTLAKYLPEMIFYAKQKGLVDTRINTNGTTLTRELSFALIASGLDNLSFSFDSPYEEEYNKIRVNSNYQKTLERIKKFKPYRDQIGSLTPYITVQIVIYPGTSQETIEDFKKLFAGFVDEVRTCQYIPHSNNDKEAGSPNINSFEWVCPQLFQRMFIHSDGLVTPCCNDSSRKLVMGNINEESVSQIWNGARYKELRQAHIEGRGMDISPCNQCGLAAISYELQNEQ